MEHLVKLELSFSSLVLSCISGCIIIHEHLSYVFLKKRHASLNCNRHVVSGSTWEKKYHKKSHALSDRITNAISENICEKKYCELHT